MKTHITFDAFKSLPWEEKLSLLRGYTLSDEQMQDDKRLYQLAVARKIMDEEYDVLKRLANS